MSLMESSFRRDGSRLSTQEESQESSMIDYSFMWLGSISMRVDD